MNNMNIKNYGKTKKIISQITLNVIIFVLIIIMLYPLAMALWNSFKSDYNYAYTKWYPTLPLRITNIKDVFGEVVGYIGNTIIVAIMGIGGQIIIACLASYAFAKLEFPGRKYLFTLVLALMMVPSVLTLTPSFMLYKNMKLLDNLWALILSQWSGGTIACIFLLYAFFSGIPNDIFEASRIDGSSELHSFIVMAVPLSVPIIATQAIMSIVGVWNDYLWPMIVLSNRRELMTISAALVLVFSGEHSQNVPLTYSGYLLSSVPLIFLFVFANKFYIEGLIGSSIKM